MNLTNNTNSKKKNSGLDFYQELTGAKENAQSAEWESVLIRLTSVPRTRRQLFLKLKERGCPAGVAGPLLDRFEELKLIDDAAYALLFIDAKRDFGLRRLRDELRARGVSRDVIEDAISESGSDENESERAAALLRRWLRLPGMTPQKLKGRLDRRGFTYSAVSDAFEICRSEMEADEDAEDNESQFIEFFDSE